MMLRPEQEVAVSICARFGRVGAVVALLAGSLTAGIALSAPAGAAGSDWSIVAAPATNASDFLAGVDCVGRSFCAAVGGQISPTFERTFIELWNGRRWRIVPSPNATTLRNDLYSVSCVDRSACTAVGFANTGTVFQSLIESWNGHRWRIVPSPNSSPTLTNAFTSVSCSTRRACIAVGYDFDSGGNDHSLIESWNGQHWSIVPAPDASLASTLLTGVSCTGRSACTAVGVNTIDLGFPFGPAGQTLVETWNGAAWSIVPSPNATPTGDNALEGVSCSTRNACTAVGWAETGVSDQTLIESWNGSAWSVVPSPNPSATEFNALSGVSCSRVNACTAVGTYQNGGINQTLIEWWNGGAWSIVPSPNTATTHNNGLGSVSCRSRLACSAVGSFDTDTTSRPLVESRPGLNG